MNSYVPSGLSIVYSVACAVVLAALPPLATAQPQIPDAVVQSLVTRTQQYFWGNAVLSSGEKVQPVDDAERAAAVIPLADSARVVDAARPVGQAMWCGVEWQRYYLEFMQSERRKPWSEKQIAFIGMLFGFTQSAFSSALTQRGPCPAEARERVARIMGEATNAPAEL